MVCQDCSVTGFERVAGHAKWQLLQLAQIRQIHVLNFIHLLLLILKIARVGYNSVLQYKGLKWLYCISSL